MAPLHAPHRISPLTPTATYRVTVLAADVIEDHTIGSQQVKRITVDEKKYQEFKAKEKDRGEMLTGNQPIGRITSKSLVAEEPVYANDVKPMHVPVL